MTSLNTLDFFETISEVDELADVNSVREIAEFDNVVEFANPRALRCRIQHLWMASGLSLERTKGCHR